MKHLLLWRRTQSIKMGRSKSILNPEKLWEYFIAYVANEANNPMFKVDYVGKDGERVKTPLETPITFEGFECYLADKGVINDLGDYSSNKGGSYTEFSTIITRVKKNCFVHNYKGAAVGLFNANLISRKLGITDKQETKLDATFTGLNIHVIKSGIPPSTSEKDYIDE